MRRFMYRNPAAAYKQTNINTASPAELTMMLYDGAVKFCNMAIMALDKGDLESCNRNIAKTKKIIVEFRSTLDFRYEVSEDFDRVYEYIHWVLTQANVKKDRELLEEALKRIREMRDTWRELMKAAKEEQQK
jgi:flagellar protein FliS